MAFSMTDSQKCTLTITAVDKKGNPAALPAGAVSWLVDNTAVVALTPSADGSTCDAAAVGPLGTATISVKVSDATGTTLAAGSIDCTITGGAATTITINPGAPVEQ